MSKDQVTCSVLDHPKLREFRRDIESVLGENKYFEKILHKILQSKLLHEATTNKNVNTSDKLKKKLRFKLARIIICLRKLTNACDKNFMNDSYQYKYVTDAFLPQSVDIEKLCDAENDAIDDEEEAEDDDDDLDIELELHGLGLNDFEDFNSLSFTQLRLSKASLPVENDDEEDDDDDDDVIKTDRTDAYVDVNLDIKEFKRFYVFNLVLDNHGTHLDETSLVEYTEDIMGSIENEIDECADDLRGDFPHIDNYVKELRAVIAKEWLSRFEDKFLRNTYGQKVSNLNLETDEKK